MYTNNTVTLLRTRNKVCTVCNVCHQEDDLLDRLATFTQNDISSQNDQECSKGQNGPEDDGSACSMLEYHL
jgi:hypothetical protein